MMNTEPTYFNNLGLSQFEFENYDAALTSYEQAIKLESTRCNNEPDRSRDNLSFYHKNLGLAYYHMEMFEEAKAEYEKAIGFNSLNADNYFNRGNVFLNKMQFDEAHRDFDEAIEREKKNAKFYHAKGLAFQAEAENLARKQYPKPQNPDEEARIFALKEEDREEEERRIKLAIRFFKFSLEYNPTFISSMFHLGLMFRRTEKFHEALQQFTEVQKLLEDDKSIYIQRGLVYQDMGNHQYAIRDFEEAIRIEPSYALSHFHMGVSKLKSRLVREAIEDFKESLMLEENPAVYDGLGCCYHALEEFDEAIEHFEKAIAAKPHNIEFLRNRA